MEMIKQPLETMKDYVFGDENSDFAEWKRTIKIEWESETIYFPCITFAQIADLFSRGSDIYFITIDCRFWVPASFMQEMVNASDDEALKNMFKMGLKKMENLIKEKKREENNNESI